jgi:hypothetical protein
MRTSPRATTRTLLSLIVTCASLAPATGLAAAAPAGSARSGSVRIEYLEPKDASHRPLYEELRKVGLLEKFGEVIGTVRLPRPLLIKFTGCDGESNAWYDDQTQQVTFCYEFVADIARAAPGAAAYGITEGDAVMGPVAFFLMHECAHALFALLQVPLLGREEDAADQVAAYVMLRAGKDLSRRVLGASAYMFKHGASSRTLDESDFADVHGLDVQRLYNVLCMAYGFDSEYFAAIVQKGHLPQERAADCHLEFAQVGSAVRRLISPNLDPSEVKRVKAARKKRTGI